MTTEQMNAIIAKIESIHKATNEWLETYKKAKTEKAHMEIEYILKAYAFEQNGIRFTLNILGYDWDFNLDGSIYIHEKGVE